MAKEPCILVAGATSQELDALFPFAQALAGKPPSNIIALGLIQLPKEESLSAGARAARRLREAVEGRARHIGARVVVRVAHDIWRELNKTIEEEDCTLGILAWHSALPQDWLRTLPCDVAVVKPPLPPPAPRILLPIRGGPYAAVALRLALNLAEAQGGQITVMHVTSPSQHWDESYQEFLQHLRALPQVTRWVNPRGNPIRAIIGAAREHDLVVMGGTAGPPQGVPPIGPIATRVLRRVKVPAIVVRTPQPLYASRTLTPAGGPVDFTISVVVDKWFAENTFHAREFKNIARLVELKEKQGLTISLGLPTLNEEKTIGEIIQTMRDKFMRRYRLLDEIVVIDSNSTDRTTQIAQSLGVPVVKHPEVLLGEKPRERQWAGKGEALWNSLHILRGDLIAWIDTDIVNIHPRFVYGILGPLIREPRLMYVKGFYQRPLRFGGKIEARGGGRVTELVARPLLNLFYPQLSGFVQPLAGEYAGRRKALESVPFVVGYGVEIALLIDLWQKFGLNAIGQVDLEERVHRNRSLIELSQMAFEIIQVVMKRVGTQHHVALMNELNESMKLIRYTRDEFQLDVVEIRAHERPPMITVPEYRARRGIED